jgi:hypothetical protein
VKAVVDKRDKGCRVIRCLTLTESKIVEKIKSFNKRLDRAHMLSASSRPEHIYNPKNVMKISRTFHERLDNYKDLMTGEPIESNERFWWCWRIMNIRTDKYLESIDYEAMIMSELTSGIA